MISQKQMKEWIPEAIERFKSQMPQIGVPFPEIFIASAKTENSLRLELLDLTQAPAISEYGTAYMEFLHGDCGDAIIIYQRRFNEQNIEWKINPKLKFQHMLWHELGHFYAINSENPNYNYSRFLDLSFDECEAEMQHSYIFWSEFIAESIACRVSPDSNIEWGTENWRPYRTKLEQYAADVVHNKSKIECVYSLSFYIATAVADKGTIDFIQAAKDGRITEEVPGRLSEGLGVTHRKTLVERGTDPFGLERTPSPYIPLIKRIQCLMEDHLKKEHYWLITPQELDDLSDPIQLILNLKRAGY